MTRRAVWLALALCAARPGHWCGRHELQQHRGQGATAGVAVRLTGVTGNTVALGNVTIAGTGIGSGSGGANSLGSSFRTSNAASQPFYVNANATGISTIFKLVGYPDTTDTGAGADNNIIATLRSLNGLASGGLTEVANSQTTIASNGGLGVACDLF